MKEEMDEICLNILNKFFYFYLQKLKENRENQILSDPSILFCYIYIHSIAPALLHSHSDILLCIFPPNTHYLQSIKYIYLFFLIYPSSYFLKINFNIFD